MTPAIIIMPYNDPDPAVRRLHVRWMHGACGWAIDHGYAPVCSVLHMATVNDAPYDTDGEVRARMLDYSTTMARMVGAAGGDCIILDVPMTSGMVSDYDEWFYAQVGCGGQLVRVTLADIEPYLPRDLVGGLQDAVDEMVTWKTVGRHVFVDIVANHTGITPTEVK